jgi:hypothetical protein
VEKMIKEICGKMINVKSLLLESSDLLNVKMVLTTEDRKTFSVLFSGVSSFEIKDVSFPFEISALEVIDNTARGYQADKRFFVNDYEDGRLSFYCEKITI